MLTVNGQVRDLPVEPRVSLLDALREHLGLTGSKKKTLRTIANYLSGNAGRMRYDEYLRAGYPIASGVIEGACRHYVKDRLERSGMRWTEQMAEAIVQLRAIYLSGDFDRYWEFHIEQDQRRLYPVPWSVVPK